MRWTKSKSYVEIAQATDVSDDEESKQVWQINYVGEDGKVKMEVEKLFGEKVPLEDTNGLENLKSKISKWATSNGYLPEAISTVGPITQEKRRQQRKRV